MQRQCRIFLNCQLLGRKRLFGTDLYRRRVHSLRRGRTMDIPHGTGTRDTRISGRKRIPRFYRCQFCTKHQKLSPRYSHAHITAKRNSLSRKFHGWYLDADRHASETIGHRIVLAETERYICHVSRRHLFRPNRQWRTASVANFFRTGYCQCGRKPTPTGRPHKILRHRCNSFLLLVLSQP